MIEREIVVNSVPLDFFLKIKYPKITRSWNEKIVRNAQNGVVGITLQEGGINAIPGLYSKER